MAEPDWTTLPVVTIPVADLRWDGQGIQPDHLEDPRRPRPLDAVPIRAERLSTGHWYIHDGRHRTMRAIARGETTVQAHGYAHW